MDFTLPETITVGTVLFIVALAVLYTSRRPGLVDIAKQTLAMYNTLNTTIENLDKTMQGFAGVMIQFGGKMDTNRAAAQTEHTEASKKMVEIQADVNRSRDETATDIQKLLIEMEGIRKQLSEITAVVNNIDRQFTDVRQGVDNVQQGVDSAKLTIGAISERVEKVEERVSKITQEQPAVTDTSAPETVDKPLDTTAKGG